jgi:MFS family permease
MFFAAFAYRQRTAARPLVTPSLMKNRGFTSGLQVCLVAVAAGAGLLFELSLFLQEGLHISPKDTSLALLPLTPGLVAAGFAAMGGLAAKPGRRLVFIGLTLDLAGGGCVLALVERSGTNVSLWALAPAYFVIGVGIGLRLAAIPTVALGDAEPDEAGSASGSFSSIQQLAPAIGSAAVTSIFFRAASSGMAHAMEVTLIVVLALTVPSLPVTARCPVRRHQNPTSEQPAKLSSMAGTARPCPASGS